MSYVYNHTRDQLFYKLSITYKAISKKIDKKLSQTLFFWHLNELHFKQCCALQCVP